MKISKRLKILAVTSLMILTMSFSAFAANSSQLNSAINLAMESGVGASTIITLAKSAGAVTDKSDLDEVTGNMAVEFKINDNTYYILQSASDNLLTVINKAGEDSANVMAEDKPAVSDVATQIDNINMPGANIADAQVALSGFQDMLALLMGIGATIAVLGLGLFTTVDVCYLSIPVLHTQMDNVGSSGGKMSAQSKEGGTKFALVTDDAVYSYNKAQEDGKQPWGIYLKRRIVTFIMMAIIIYILMTGKVDIIIDLALKMTGGIIDQLTQLATF